MVTVVTDPTGRLLELRAVPTDASEEISEPRAPDWPALFAKAALPIEQFTPVAPTHTPPIYADSRAAWTGKYPGRPDVSLRVETAAVGRRAVYFRLAAPWTPTDPDSASAATSTTPPPVVAAVIALNLTLLIVALVIGRRNLRLGRGDRRGAFRLSTSVGSVIFLAGLLTTHSAASLLGGLVPCGPLTPHALSLAVLVWIIYIAIEPHVRRIWPEMLVSWSRLLGGALRDPLVGRDLLIGALAGTLMAAVLHLHVWLSPWVGAMPPLPLPVAWVPRNVLDAAYASALHASLVASAIAEIVIGVLMLLLLTLLFRRRRGAATVVMIGVLTLINFAIPGGNPVIDFVFVGVFAAVAVVTLVRFGVLAAMVAMFSHYVLILATLAFDSATPYAFANYLGTGMVGGLALYGFHTALAGRSLFGSVLADEAAAP